MEEDTSEASKLIKKLQELEFQLIKSGDKSEETEEHDKVHKEFMEVFKQDKEASLTAVLKYLSDLVPAKVPLPKIYLANDQQKEEMRRHVTDILRRSITNLIEKSLKNASEQELPEIAKFLERQAGLDAVKFDVSDTNQVDKLISCMQMAVPLYARDANIINFLEFINKHCILPNFQKLPEQRKLDFLRALAEISPLATTLVAGKMFPSIVELLMANMPEQKIEEKNILMPERKIEEKFNYAYVECLQYVLHHLDNKITDDTRLICNKPFKMRLKCVAHITLARMKKLAQTFREHDKDVREAEKFEKTLYLILQKFFIETRRQNAKTEVRSCNNILAMTKVLEGKTPSFIIQDIVNLSWKESRSPPAAKIHRETESPMNRERLNTFLDDNSFSRDKLALLKQFGHCNLTSDEVVRLLGPSRFEQLLLDPEGSFVLNDCGGVAMLNWQIKESEFSSSFVKGRNSNKGISGDVRNQFFHIICWAYVASDMVSALRCMQKWEDKCYPLCTWYLCAFCDPESLGKDEETGKPDKKGCMHHCYGYTIEGALHHIQENGIPREVLDDFMCTDHQPPTADEPEKQSRKIKKVRRISSLKDAMIELQKNPKQPIGADLIAYSSVFLSGIGDKKQIYYGPKSGGVLIGYHAVLIEDFQIIDGNLVAICKMSNGPEVANGGYSYVSVTTQYMPVGVSQEKRKYVRGSSEPQHLLTDFVIIEMDEKEIDEDEEEEDMEEDMEEDNKEDDANDEEPGEEEPEEEPEEKEYIPISKRLCTREKKVILPRIRYIKLLRVLGQGDTEASDLMTDILAEVATKTESNNAGNALLYECVETIMATEDTSSLRVLVMNILGRFLSNRDSNIRHVALNMLMKAIAFDDEAVQRHIVTILECVKDPGASIRKRALELVSLLVNENDVKQVTKELIDYLEISDEDFKEDLSAKICSIVEKFSAEKSWYTDQMLKVLSEAGKFVKDDVWHALIVVISNASELHGYTVRALYKAVLTYSEQETLVRVAIWCIGEYGDLLVNNVGMLDIEDPITVTECDAVDVIEDAITRHNSDMTTKAMALVALRKLSSRFPSISERIKYIIVKQKGSLLLEMQQRAIEFNYIVDRHKNIRSSLVERMPVLDEATFNVRRAGSLPSVSIPNGVAAAPLVDLLDLDSDKILAAPSSSGADFLKDLLGVDLGATPAPKAGTLSSPAPPHIATTASAGGMFDLLDGLSPSPLKEATNGPAYPPIVAYESSSSKTPGNPQTTNVLATFTDFVFQAAVSKFLQLHLDPANSNTLPASGNITQNRRVTNSQHGKKSLVRIAYKVNGKDVLEEGQINNFPRGL